MSTEWAFPGIKAAKTLIWPLNSANVVVKSELSYISIPHYVFASWTETTFVVRYHKLFV
jgi:hypothetical protein